MGHSKWDIPPKKDDALFNDYILDLHHHTFGIGPETTGILDDDNITEVDADTLDGLDSTDFFILAGQSGGQIAFGDIDSGGDLTFSSTAHASKASIFFGTGANRMEFKEDDNKLVLGNITFNSEDSRADIGDPGFEAAGINIDGTVTKTGMRMNDFGAENPAQIIAHRHSTSIPPEFIGARTNSDDATHTAVVEGMCTLKLSGVGWTGSHYDRFGDITVCPDAGTISSTSSPGRMIFSTTPDGSDTPTEKLRIDQAGATYSPKMQLTTLGGYAIKLTNETGADTIAGQLIKADTAVDDAVVLAGITDNECFGVFLESGISDGAEAWVVVAGIADVAFDDNVAAVRGDWIATGAAAGYARTQASPAAAPTHFEEVGHCIESVAAGGGGTHILARCVLHFN